MIHIVDVGCGYGDMLRVVWRWARRRGVGVRLTGVDLHQETVEIAREATRLPADAIEWIAGDVTGLELREAPDVVISSLVAHHLERGEIVALLRWMESSARMGWFINDLHRQPGPVRVYRVLARVMRWHRFVQHDGPVSFRRAFRAGDWNDLLKEAGMCGGTRPRGVSGAAVRGAAAVKGQGVLVLGGGVAGAAVATLLARTGERVTLLEQYAEPRHKMCGEFLSTEACESLRVIGIEVRELGAAPVRLLRFAGRRGYAEHPLPFAAWSLTRRRLDEAMLAMAERSGARVMRGVRVEALEPGEEGPRWRVRGSDGETAMRRTRFLLRAGSMTCAGMRGRRWGGDR